MNAGVPAMLVRVFTRNAGTAALPSEPRAT